MYSAHIFAPRKYDAFLHRVKLQILTELVNYILRLSKKLRS